MAIKILNSCLGKNYLSNSMNMHNEISKNRVIVTFNLMSK